MAISRADGTEIAVFRSYQEVSKLKGFYYGNVFENNQSTPISSKAVRMAIDDIKLQVQTKLGEIESLSN